jgi:hypothetical protein
LHTKKLLLNTLENLGEDEKMSTIYYKVLLNNHSCVGSNMDWTPYLPVKNDDGTWTAGEWTPRITGKLELCARGYHLTDAEHLVDWIVGNQLFEVELKWKILSGDDKIACRQVRLLCQIESWNDRSLRLFAVWCAREALKLVKEPDPRSIAACDVAEKYANGEATKEELDAARAAAWYAARDAARAAAWYAARDAAWYATWDAAWDAARDAARDAAWYAARDAARDAARYAARYAAWDATNNAAWDAARDAAWYAARDAAWDAARAAAWYAQSKHLIEMLELEK